MSMVLETGVGDGPYFKVCTLPDALYASPYNFFNRFYIKEFDSALSKRPREAASS